MEDDSFLEGRISLDNSALQAPSSTQRHQKNEQLAQKKEISDGLDISDDDQDDDDDDVSEDDVLHWSEDNDDDDELEK